MGAGRAAMSGATHVAGVIECAVAAHPLAALTLTSAPAASCTLALPRPFDPLPELPLQAAMRRTAARTREP